MNTVQLENFTLYMKDVAIAGLIQKMPDILKYGKFEDFTTAKKLLPVGLDLMIPGSRVDLPYLAVLY